MKQFTPAVRALCERVRRPNTVRLLAGLALIAPAVMLEGRADGPKTALEPQRIAPLVIDVSKEAIDQALAATRFAMEYKIPEPLAEEIHQAAIVNGISPKVAFGLVRAESGFRPKVTSPVGAVGLTQVMPSTARWLEPGTTRTDLMEPSTNLRLGFKYLRQLIDEYEGNERLALTAFNRGPGTVNKLLKRGRNPDNGYADKVLTGKSAKHVALMNKKFGKKRRPGRA